MEASSESERTRLKEVSSSLSFASMLNGFWLQPETLSLLCLMAGGEVTAGGGRWRCGNGEQLLHIN